MLCAHNRCLTPDVRVHANTLVHSYVQMQFLAVLLVVATAGTVGAAESTACTAAKASVDTMKARCKEAGTDATTCETVSVSGATLAEATEAERR